MKCPDCDQPMLPAGRVKRQDEYDHASGCPRTPAARDCPQYKTFCVKPEADCWRCPARAAEPNGAAEVQRIEEKSK